MEVHKFSEGDKVRVIRGDREIVQFCLDNPAIVKQIDENHKQGNGTHIYRVNHGDEGWYSEDELKAWPKSFAPEVIADHTGKWVGTTLRFATHEEAEKNVAALMSRWLMVTDTRVVESDDEPNHKWTKDGLVRLGR